MRGPGDTGIGTAGAVAGIGAGRRGGAAASTFSIGAATGGVGSGAWACGTAATSARGGAATATGAAGGTGGACRTGAGAATVALRGATGADGGGAEAGAAAGAGAAGRGAAADAGLVRIGRVLTFSTTTVFDRPWEKLCLTTPASTGRLSDNVLEGAFCSVICGFVPIRGVSHYVVCALALSKRSSRQYHQADAAFASASSCPGSAR